MKLKCFLLILLLFQSCGSLSENNAESEPQVLCQEPLSQALNQEPTGQGIPSYPEISEPGLVVTIVNNYKPE